jgi:hypothetical protein
MVIIALSKSPGFNRQATLELPTQATFPGAGPLVLPVGCAATSLAVE